MKTNLKFRLIALALLLISLISAHASQNINTLAGPNLVWHNSVTGSNRVWSLTGGTNFLSYTNFYSNAGDASWKMVGIADFDGNGSPDILWQNVAQNLVAVWYFTNQTQISSAWLPNPSQTNWFIVGVADFNKDGVPDILWQYGGSPTSHYVWYMGGSGGTNIIGTGELNPEITDTNWMVSCAANFGASTTNTPTIVWRYQLTGDIAFWYMSLTNKIGSTYLSNTNGSNLAQSDLDEQIVGAWDANGDGQNDLIFHHQALGLLEIWYLNMNTNTSGAYPSYESAPEWSNLDWTVTSQPTLNQPTAFRLSPEYGTPVNATATSSSITLSAGVQFNVAPESGDSMSVYKRVPPATTWNLQMSGLGSTNYTDSTTTSGQAYEYEVTFSHTAGNGHESAFIKAANSLSFTNLENRGTIIVMLDSNLVTQAATASTMSSISNQVNADLVADGWTVTNYVALRHDFTLPAYSNSLQNIRAFISSVSGAKGILIIGHVTIPYTGDGANDNHPNHNGAWPADMYYGMTSTTGYTDTVVNDTNSAYADNWNIPYDRKFDPGYAQSAMNLFVGRVDFANLPAFGVTNTAGSTNEANLIEQYFTKVHNYRNNTAPYAGLNSNQKGIVYNTFALDYQPQWPYGSNPLQNRPPPAEMVYENAKRGFAAMFSGGIGNLTVGYPFYQTFENSYLWGFAAGPGASDQIAQLQPSATTPYLQITSSNLASGPEPQIGFHMLLGSYFGDWNMTNDFMRAVLATPAYGLAAIWHGATPTMWELHGLGLGDTLGQCAQTTINNPMAPGGGDDNARWVTIIGDPTLRMNMITPPSSPTATLSGGSVTANWTTNDTQCTYNVYRGPSTNGPFTRLTSTPISGPPYTVTDDPNNRAYMIRGMKLTSSGCGSYQNLSVGPTTTAH